MPDDQKRIDEAATDAAAGAKAAEGEAAGAAPATKKPDDQAAFFQQLIDLLLPMMPAGFGQALKAFSAILGGTYGQEEKTAETKADGQAELPADEVAAAPEGAPISVEPAAAQEQARAEEGGLPPSTQPDIPALTQEEKADLVYEALLAKFDSDKDGKLGILEAQGMNATLNQGGGLSPELEAKITKLMTANIKNGDPSKGEFGLLDKTEFRNIAKQLEGDIDVLVDQLIQKGVLSAEDATKLVSTSATQVGVDQNSSELTPGS